MFESICDILGNKAEWYMTKTNDYQIKLLSDLITWPTAQVFPCLDMYRIFMLHPDATLHFKKFEDGANNIGSILGYMNDSSAGDPVKMLSLRCICNMFNVQSAQFVLRERRQKVIDGVSAHLKHPKATIRESAITILLNFSILFL